MYYATCTNLQTQIILFLLELSPQHLLAQLFHRGLLPLKRQLVSQPYTLKACLSPTCCLVSTRPASAAIHTTVMHHYVCKYTHTHHGPHQCGSDRLSSAHHDAMPIRELVHTNEPRHNKQGVGHPTLPEVYKVLYRIVYYRYELKYRSIGSPMDRANGDHLLRDNLGSLCLKTFEARRKKETS